jgi:hypothetical protein
MGCLTLHALRGIMSIVTRQAAERKVATLSATASAEGCRPFPVPTQWRQRNCTMSGAVPSATIPFHALSTATAYDFPVEGQEHGALLQANNTDSTRTQAEAAELQVLVNADNACTLDKANARLAWQRRGADTGAQPRLRTLRSRLRDAHVWLHAPDAAVHIATHRSP